MKLDFRDVSITVYVLWAGIMTAELFIQVWGYSLTMMVTGLVMGAFGPMMAITFVYWYFYRDKLRGLAEDAN